MQNKLANFWQNNKVSVIAILLFTAISFAYLSPMLEGKKLYQGDIQNFNGGQKEAVDYKKATGQQA